MKLTGFAGSRAMLRQASSSARGPHLSGAGGVELQAIANAACATPASRDFLALINGG
jgi:hypothetical protein